MNIPTFGYQELRGFQTDPRGLRWHLYCEKQALHPLVLGQTECHTSHSHCFLSDRSSLWLWGRSELQVPSRWLPMGCLRLCRSGHRTWLCAMLASSQPSRTQWSGWLSGEGQTGSTGCRWLRNVGVLDMEFCLRSTKVGWSQVRNRVKK